MSASEAAPFAKTGGLADVMGALPAALAELGHHVAIVIPRYRAISLDGFDRVYDHLPVWLAGVSHRTEIFARQERGVTVFLVDCPPLYDRNGLYFSEGVDYADNHVRFAVLSRATLEIARRLFRPQILHCHDWQSALAIIYLHSTLSRDPTFLGLRTVFTVHNLGYQGRFARPALEEAGLDMSVFHPGALEFHGDMNLLKGGICFADAITTVSKGYARDIQTPEFGFGLDGLLRERSYALRGILNGADYSQWDPETDRLLPANYSARKLEGKLRCKQALLEEFGLPQEDMRRPLLGIVSRFTAQKGFDLLEEISEELAGEELCLVALGEGEPRYEDLFRGLAERHPGTVGVRIAYDNRLAHLIEAGADMFLMPSRYEPCGLNQIYSLRYGTVPIVRATGGLDDTVDTSTGFKFSEYSGAALMAAVRAALDVYANQDRWRALMRRGMAKDFSWKTSAAEYSALYASLLDRA